MAGLQVTGPASPSVVTVQAKSSFVTTGAVVGTTETTIVIPLAARAFSLHTAAGSSAILTISSSSGGTASVLTSWDLKMGCVWSEEALVGAASLTVYIKSNKVGTNVQLMYWI